jgi:uncharacterized repeat protein (TIGR01451 family)
MKRLVVAAVVAAGVVGMAMVAGAAVDITNTATSTYQITGNSAAASGWDTAIVRVLSNPVITVAKWAKNQRTGIENADMVQAVTADVIEFRVTFVNAGEADADTVVLRDYIPSGLTFGAVLSNTATAGVTVQAESYSAAGLVATYNAVGGTVAGQDNGQVVFTMTVN